MSSRIRSCSRGSMTYMNGLPSLLVARKTRTAVPSCPAIMPQHSLGSSARAWATSCSASSRGMITGALPLPEDAAVEPLLHCLVVVAPQAGGEVLPAAVRDDADHRAALHAAGDLDADVHDRARGDPREDALLRCQPPRHRQRVRVADQELPVEPRDVEDRGHEAVVEVAQAH